MSTNKIYGDIERHRPQVMGIININNESFYRDSRCLSPSGVLEKVENMLQEGAEIIDLGACSTRPGSEPVSLEQEWNYLREPLRSLARYVREPGGYFVTNGTRHTISVDTFHAQIVERVYDTIGPFTVNDISAGEDDPHMLETVGRLQLPYIAMHKRGTPSTMQQMCNYPNGVVNEVIRYFKAFEQQAAAFGIREIIIDPGYGFAKTIDQNYELLAGLPQLAAALQKEESNGRNIRPRILAGISRKGMIWKPLGITPEEALCGTAALHLQALLLGAGIIRVHDVKEGVQCVKLYDLLGKYLLKDSYFCN